MTRATPPKSTSAVELQGIRGVGLASLTLNDSTHEFNAADEAGGTYDFSSSTPTGRSCNAEEGAVAAVTQT